MADSAAPVTTRADPALVKALARAFRYQRMLNQGIHGSVTEMAVAEKIDRGYLGRVLQLTLLSPDLVEAILDGRTMSKLDLPTLLRPLPEEWGLQLATLLSGARSGLAASPTKQAALDDVLRSKI